MLEEIGFGLEASLMHDPKVFVDSRFLGALIVELDDELGPEEASRSLFQIGLLHGLRDAARVAASLDDGAPGGLEAGLPTPLAIQLGARCSSSPAAGIEVRGHWPEHYEAGAWLAKLGPSDDPVCALSCGYTSGWLSGTMEADLVALEAECTACGLDACRFVAREVAVWDELGDERCVELLSGIPFAVFRELASAAAMSAGSTPAMPSEQGMLETHGAFEVGSSVVHIWGPVMVVPFQSAEQGLHAIEVLSRDPSTADVRAVVVDLTGCELDEDFGASALEQVLETIVLWGAEALLTGASALSEAVVEGLEAQHLLVRKDLPEAIATAFQIAEAQRYTI